MTQDEDGGVAWVSHGAEQTREAGEMLGRICRGGEVILLEGPLGAGKTVFTQGVARGLGIKEPTTSPTFTILKEYNGRLALAHFDFYRVDTARAVDVEFDDYVGATGVCVMEWASRVPHVIPRSMCWWNFVMEAMLQNQSYDCSAPGRWASVIKHCCASGDQRHWTRRRQVHGHSRTHGDNLLRPWPDYHYT